MDSPTEFLHAACAALCHALKTLVGSAASVLYTVRVTVEFAVDSVCGRFASLTSAPVKQAPLLDQLLLPPLNPRPRFAFKFLDPVKLDYKGNAVGTTADKDEDSAASGADTDTDDDCGSDCAVAATMTSQAPQLGDFYALYINGPFTYRIRSASWNALAIFDTEEECDATIRLLSAVHGFDPRIFFRRWLVPYFRVLLAHFEWDEQRAFEYVIRHPHLYAGVSAKTEYEGMCWSQSCICAKPRHIFSLYPQLKDPNF